MHYPGSFGDEQTAPSFEMGSVGNQPVVHKYHRQLNTAATACGPVWVFLWIWSDRISGIAIWECHSGAFPTAPIYTDYRTSIPFTRLQEFYR